MKRNIISLLILTLVLILAACGTGKLGEGSVAKPTPSVPAETPTASPASLSEEKVRDMFESDGYFRVLNIIPYGGDYVAEVTDHEGNKGWRALYWVFGETGERAWLNRDITDQEIDTYRILSHGTVEIITTGKNTNVPVTGVPRSYNAIVTVDSQGRLLEDWDEMLRVTTMETTTHGDWRLLDGKDSVNGNPSYDGGISGRYEQIYEARIGVDDISFSFIPSGDDMDRFTSFFPAATSVPNMDCSFDPGTRQFTIRLYNTTLESGGITDKEITEWLVNDSPYLGLYPYTFSKDGLGAGNRFIQDASIVQDGEDTVLTLTLTEYAYAYDVGRRDIGWEQDIPVTRVTFREYIRELDG